MVEFITFSDGDLRPEHVHDAGLVELGNGRACEPGVQAICQACRALVAPCTQTAVSVAAVLAGRWLCAPCAGGLP